MKILIVVDVIDNGGVGIVLRNLLKHINSSKFDIEILTFEENKNYEEDIPQHIKIFHAYNINPAKSTSRLKRYMYAIAKELIPKVVLRRKFNLDKYDIVVDFKGNNLNVVTAAKCKTVYWCHKDFSPKTNLVERESMEKYSRTINGRFKEFIYRKRINSIDQIVCISEYTKEAFVQRWNYKKDIYVVHNVIDSNEIIHKSLVPIEYQKNDKCLTFCCLSRISKGKGIERLFECIDRLNCLGYEFEINIVGGGDAFDNIRKLFERKKFSNVTLWGNQDNPYPYLKESDVFVCPSETEAYCTVLCEAIVLGKPIIMTDVGASREIMSKGTFGLIVQNTEDGIFNGMKHFLDYKEDVKNFTRDYLHSVSPFNINIAITEVEDFFDECYRKI